MRAVLVAFLCLIALPVVAVQPDEILDDPALEARARAISAELRCLVCRNESIDDSSAPLARDLRLVVRERLVAGDSDDAVKDFLVARYGEYVLLTPRFTTANAFIWLTGPVLLIVSGLLTFAWLRRQSAPSGKNLRATDAPLSEEERRELERLRGD
ncbi:MAG: cytochrome c-type biogenesis protein [Pseudomonadota bacterium]